jgi:hypothetical protein
MPTAEGYHSNILLWAKIVPERVMTAQGVLGKG